jgi:hypothetical protein
LISWQVGAAFAALASWQVGVNGLVSSIEVGITGGGLIQSGFMKRVLVNPAGNHLRPGGV